MTLGALKKEVVKLALETQGSEDAMDKKSMKKIFKQQVGRVPPYGYVPVVVVAQQGHQP